MEALFITFGIMIIIILIAFRVVRNSKQKEVKKGGAVGAKPKPSPKGSGDFTAKP